MKPTEKDNSFRTQHGRRTTKRHAILSFFVQHLREKFRSDDLHARFGTSARTRISELNRDGASPVIINNETDADDHSVYWAEPRPAPQPQQSTFADTSGTFPEFGDMSPVSRYPE